MRYGFIILYPLHPTTVWKFREAFKSSGVKNDPLDADQILQILTKHTELLKPLNPDTTMGLPHNNIYFSDCEFPEGDRE